MQLTAMGIAYDKSSTTTDADMMALKALVDPSKMNPKRTTIAEVRVRAFNGRPWREWTLAKKREAGRPPSRAKAKIMRLLVVMTLSVANTRQERRHEQTDCSDGVLGGMDQYLQQGTGARFDDLVNAASDKQQHNQEDGSRKDPYADADNHNLGFLQRRVWNFFDHVCYRVKGSDSKTSLEKT